MIERPWNRCDVCGHFIAFKDFELGKAIRKLIEPDNYFSREKYETLCSKHIEENNESITRKSLPSKV